MVVMLVVEVVGFCVVVVVVLVTVFWKNGICDCCRSTIVKSILCGCGIGIGGVVVMVVIMG